MRPSCANGRGQAIRIPDTEQFFLRMRVLDAGTPQSAFALLLFWIEPQRVITMSSRTLPHVQHLKDRLYSGRGSNNVGALLLFVTELMADRLADSVLTPFRTAFVDLELAVEQEHPSAFAQVHLLRQRTTTVQSYTKPQGALLLRLHRLDLALLLKDHSTEWRAVIEYYGEGSRELDVIEERARVLENSLANRTSKQMNRRIYLLTLLSTLLLPLSLVAGLFGANVGTVDGNILGARHPLWFIALCIALVLLSWGSYTLFRRHGFL